MIQNIIMYWVLKKPIPLVGSRKLSPLYESCPETVLLFVHLISARRGVELLIARGYSWTSFLSKFVLLLVLKTKLFGQ